MPDVVAIGELLIDLIPTGRSDGKRILLEQNPGGAPANMLAGLAKLGRSVTFIGKIGADGFGRFLEAALADAGVGREGLVFELNAHTTLAVVHLDEQGDRTFTFYRDPGADQLLRVDELPLGLIESCRVLHAGSVSLSREPAAEATRAALRHARRSGITVSFDVNLRPLLWTSVDDARQAVWEILPAIDWLKMSEEELFWLTGEVDPERGSELLIEQYGGLSLCLVTLGPDGACARSRCAFACRPAFEVEVVDTTGAGDAFCAALIDQLLGTSQPDRLSQAELEALLDRSCAAGSLVASRRGALAAMPTANELDKFAGGVRSPRRESKSWKS